MDNCHINSSDVNVLSARNISSASVDSEGSQKLISPHVSSHPVKQKEDRMRGVLLVVAILTTIGAIVVMISMPVSSMAIICFFCGVSLPLIICCTVILGRHIKKCLIEQRGKHLKDEQSCHHSNKKSSQYRQNTSIHCHQTRETDTTSLSSEKKDDRKRVGARLFSMAGLLFGFVCLFFLGMLITHSMPLLGLCMVAAYGCILSSVFIYGIVDFYRGQPREEERKNSLKGKT